MSEITHSLIAVSITSAERRTEAEKWAAANGFEWVLDLKKLGSHYQYVLLFTPDFIGLQKISEQRKTPFHINFLSRQMLYRAKKASLRNELLARAIGLKPQNHPLIYDLTAGLGRDAFLLSTLGFSVTMLERSPIVHLLLADGLARAKNDVQVAPFINRLKLVKADANYWLQKLSNDQFPDVIYLDPMFPPKQKTASVKKEMVFLQDLLGKCQDQEDLFLRALDYAKKRVILKRPRLAAPILNKKPNFSLKGNSSRFDIYITITAPTN